MHTVVLITLPYAHHWIKDEISQYHRQSVLPSPHIKTDTMPGTDDIEY